MEKSATLPASAALLLIDVQKGFDSPYWGIRNNPQAEANMKRILDVWRRTVRPVVHVRHMSVEPDSPLRPNQSGNEFKPETAPIEGERVEEKVVNSAFIGTKLEAYLRGHGIETVVIVGLTTDHCVSTSTRMAGNLGFRTYVICDATATFSRTGYDGRKYDAEEIHHYALASLHDEFATVLTTEQLLRLSDHQDEEAFNG
jgi:nicotinamidase-related amidase